MQRPAFPEQVRIVYLARPRGPATPHTQLACTSTTLPILEAPVMRGDNSLSEQPCSDSPAALGIDWEATRESHDAHSIRLGSVHFMRVLDAARHD